MHLFTVPQGGPKYWTFQRTDSLSKNQLLLCLLLAVTCNVVHLLQTLENWRKYTFPFFVLANMLAVAFMCVFAAWVCLYINCFHFIKLTYFEGTAAGFAVCCWGYHIIHCSRAVPIICHSTYLPWCQGTYTYYIAVSCGEKGSGLSGLNTVATSKLLLCLLPPLYSSSLNVY